MGARALGVGVRAPHSRGGGLYLNLEPQSLNPSPQAQNAKTLKTKLKRAGLVWNLQMVSLAFRLAVDVDAAGGRGLREVWSSGLYGLGFRV